MKCITVVCSILLAGPLMAQQSQTEIGNEIGAQISGEAAGMFTYFMDQCAEIAGDISDERMQDVRAGLSSDRGTFEGAEDVFDTHFEIGQQRAVAGEMPEASQESCEQAIAVMRSDQPIDPPR